MFFDPGEKILSLSPEEMLSVAWQRYASIPEDESLCPVREDASFADISFSFPLAEGKAVLKGKVKREGAALLFAYTFGGDPEVLPPLALRRIRGLGFLYAYMAGGGAPLPIRFRVESCLSDKSNEWEETPTSPTLCQFFRRAKEALEADAGHAVDKAVRRMPTLANLPFPYSNIREGQREMIHAVYATVKQKGTLFAMAPTGTGKTMAALFPALRALGKGYTEKIFYFTSKTNLSAAATAALEELAAKGAKVLAAVIVAKEKICPKRQQGWLCRECPLSHGRKKKEAAATEALYATARTVLGEEDFCRTAAAFDVCPYELSLSYARLADVVIGDYNYLFAPHAYLRRFFDGGGHYAFLLDEAHNLPDRAREMYSGGLSGSFLNSLSTLVTAGAPPLCEGVKKLKAAYRETAAGMLKDVLHQDAGGESCGFAVQKNLPLPLFEATEALALAARDYLRQAEKPDKALADALYSVMNLADKMAEYDGHFLFYALKEGGNSCLKFFCADPSAQIGKRLAKGDSAVFFSATLTPLDYYRAVLSGKRPAAVLEVPSPFPPESLCVGVMDKVSVRAAAREETAAEVARIIATVLKAKRGNYMVFCPSFAYMERIAQAFHTLAPKVETAVQKRNMSAAERRAFLDRFVPREKSYFVAFCVTGGVYAEGIDLVGDRLIGAVIVGVGLPQVSAERELIAAYYQEASEEGKEYAYLYPGMNRILQAAGRVIRREEDRGVVILIDDRFRDPACRKIFPPGWHGLKYAGNRAALSELLRRFWEGN